MKLAYLMVEQEIVKQMYTIINENWEKQTLQNDSFIHCTNIREIHFELNKCKRNILGIWRQQPQHWLLPREPKSKQKYLYRYRQNAQSLALQTFVFWCEVGHLVNIRFENRKLTTWPACNAVSELNLGTQRRSKVLLKEHKQYFCVHCLKLN